MYTIKAKPITAENFRAYGRTMQFFVWLIVVAMVVSDDYFGRRFGRNILY